MVYKCRNNLASPYLCELFFTNSIQSYDTRQSFQLRTIKPNTNFKKKK